MKKILKISAVVIGVIVLGLIILYFYDASIRKWCYGRSDEKPFISRGVSYRACLQENTILFFK